MEIHPHLIKTKIFFSKSCFSWKIVDEDEALYFVYLVVCTVLHTQNEMLKHIGNVRFKNPPKPTVTFSEALN